MKLNYTKDSDEESIANDENENVLMTLMPRKRCRVLSSSNSDEENVNTKIETAVDGTVGLKFYEGGIPGRVQSTCIFKSVKEPTGYAKRNIMADNLINLAAIYAGNLYKETKQQNSFLPNTELPRRKNHQNMNTHKDQLQHHQMQSILNNAKFFKYDFAQQQNK